MIPFEAISEMSRTSNAVSSLEHDGDYLMNALSRLIMRFCLRKGIVISESCVNYLISSMIQHPDLADGSGSISLKDNMSKLEELCIEKCSSIGAIETLKIQIYFKEEVLSREDLIRENRQKMKKRIEQNKKDLLRLMPQCNEDLEKAYHMLVTLMIVGSGIGTMSNSSALKETTVALQSVFPVNELSGFLSKPTQEKERHFEELVAIVAGIRLFNRDCHKGGQYIEDLPEILTREIKSMNETLHGLMEKIGFKIHFLSRAIESYFCGPKTASLSHSCFSKTDCKAQCSSSAEEVSIQRKTSEMKDFLVFAHQFEFFLRFISEEVYEMESFLKVLKEKLGSCLAKIHNIVQYRTAIPTAEIYPLFTDLFNIWTEFQNEIYVVNYLNNIIWNLHSHTQIFDNLDSEFLEKMIGENSHERQRILLGKESIKFDELTCSFIEVGNTKNVKDLPLELSGFCIWCLVHGDGALILGNSKLGLCEFHGYYYSFIDLNALMDFGRNPSRYIFEANLVIRRKPELAKLIKIRDEVEVKGDYNQQKGATKCDADIQTDLHPIESYIDKNYSWNEWVHRRRALQLTYIRKCQTRSVQTEKRSWLSDAGMNVSLPQTEKHSQTSKEKATNIPWSTKFLCTLKNK